MTPPELLCSLESVFQSRRVVSGNGNGQIDGAALADGPLDVNGAVGLETVQGPHQVGDTEQRRSTAGQGKNQAQSRLVLQIDR